MKKENQNTVYLNIKTGYGIETVDEFSPEPGQTLQQFKLYVNQMLNEYRLAGIDVYKSSRPTNDWKSK